MEEIQFVKGFNVKSKETQYGIMFNCGVNVEDFNNNKKNDKGWVNFYIKKSKSGNWYAELNTYTKTNEQETKANTKKVEAKEDISEQIPF